MPLSLRPASIADVALILSFIRDLAEYERLAHEVVATEPLLRETLFGERPGAEVGRYPAGEINVVAAWRIAGHGTDREGLDG